VPEIVDDGVTGFVVNTESEAEHAFKRLPELNPRRIRAVFERRFTSKRMAEEYVHYYRQLIQSHSNSAMREIA